MQPLPERNYAPLLEKARILAQTLGDGLTRERAMQHAVAMLWDDFGDHDPISWVGFYDIAQGGEEMVLVCREPKPACSPIGLHGMCGRAFLAKKSFVVRDVRVLGPDYIACDPKDQSELVVPMIDSAGRCSGVLDVDSYAIGAFTAHDAEQCAALLRALGLLAADVAAEAI